MSSPGSQKGPIYARFNWAFCKRRVASVTWSWTNSQVVDTTLLKLTSIPLLVLNVSHCACKRLPLNPERVI